MENSELFGNDKKLSELQDKLSLVLAKSRSVEVTISDHAHINVNSRPGKVMVYFDILAQMYSLDTDVAESLAEMLLNHAKIARSLE